MAEHTYRSIAQRDLKEAAIMYEHGAYNTVARFSQQVVEKTMKQLLESTADTEVYKFLKMHNLSALYRELVARQLLPFSSEMRNYLAILKDYYFDLNYPGENYREVSPDEAKEALNFATAFLADFLSE